MNDKSKKISKNRGKKEVIVAEISEKAAKAKAVVFTNYQGMTHKQLEELKKGLRKIDAEVVVAKNTLLSIVFRGKDEKFAEKEKDLFGPTATLFAYNDVVLPIKELAKTIKTLKLPVVKFGILEGRVLADTEIMRLATLPSRDVLIAKVVGGLKSPIYGLHRTLNWNLQKFVTTLKAVQDKKATSH